MAQRNCAWVAITVVVLVCLTCSLAFAAAAKPETPDAAPTCAPKLFRKVASKDGQVIVELRGHDDDLGYPTQAWTANRSGGIKTFLAAPETYIVGAAITADAKYILLVYHISSGGYAEAFERTAKAEYRKFADNNYAANEIKGGHIAGLTDRDVPDIRRGQGVFHGISLARSPDRLIFEMANVTVTYSLDERRFTGWERSLLSSWFTKKDRTFALDLAERSGTSDLALLARDSRTDELETREDTLVQFANSKTTAEMSGATTEFHLQSTKAKGIELRARKSKQDETDGETTWNVEISGTGRDFQSLLDKLSAERQIFHGKRNKAKWLNPTKFIATSWYE